MSLPPEILVKLYGDEFPQAVTRMGVRMELSSETRFSRSYHSEDGKRGTVVSRFEDNSAEVTLSELKESWHQWSAGDQCDFCSGVSWLRNHPDFADMIRFLWAASDQRQLCMIALSVVEAFPQDEAYGRLSAVLGTMPIGGSANITQAIAGTKHPDASALLSEHL